MEKQIMMMLKELFIKRFFIKVNSISFCYSLTNHLGLNEYEILELFGIVEENFSLDFNDAEVNNIKTVGQLVQNISEKKQHLNQTGKGLGKTNPLPVI